MPELPEVQALTSFLASNTTGRTISGVEVGNIAALKTFDPAPQALVGRQISDWSRRGKWMLMTAESADSSVLYLAVHLARGGWVRWHDKLPAAPVKPRLGGSVKGASIALRVRLTDGSGFDFTEAGTQKRLAVYIVPETADVPQIAELGIEPLSTAFTSDVLAELAAAKNQQIKGLLRDQSKISGIGNAYSDEILHVAKMSPFRLTGSLTNEDVERLHAAIVNTLSKAVAAAAGKPAKELKDAKRAEMRVHARAGLPCPDCGDTIREVSFADRALQYCPTCQTGGKPLADRRLSRLLR